MKDISDGKDKDIKWDTLPSGKNKGKTDI